VASGSSQVGIQLDGNEDNYASICVNALKSNSWPGYGYLRQGSLRASTGVDNLNTWYLMLGGTTFGIRASETGNVSIGGVPPMLERLRVDGGIMLGNSSGTNAGTIRWSGSDFEGYNGSAWQSFTATGGGSLPSGTTGQTLRNDGSNWVATSNLFNDGTNIGVGRLWPTEKIDVYGDLDAVIKCETGNSVTKAGVILKTNGGIYDDLELAKYAASAAGTTGGGIPVANLACVATGPMAGPLMLQVGSNNPMYFVTNNLERMRLTSDGRLGINVKAPTATLHVGGNISTGSADQNGTLNVYRAGVPDVLVALSTNNMGGTIRAFDEQGSRIFRMEPDVDGTGGFLEVDGPSESAVFYVEGNHGATGYPQVNISGASTATFDMSALGDPSVNLPVNAISGSEILDEPGVVNYATGLGAALTGSFASYASQTINAPAAGYVIVTGTADVSPSHTNGTVTNIIVSVSNSPTSIPATQNTWLYLPPVMPTGVYHYPVTVSGMFQVAAGSSTFYLDAEVTSGGGTIFERNLSILYVPTAYGSFIAPLTTASTGGEKQAGGSASTAADVAATRAASEAANADRVQRELDAMKDRVAKLEAEMRSSQGNR
jgi:hypothetical protein